MGERDSKFRALAAELAADCHVFLAPDITRIGKIPLALSQVCADLAFLTKGHNMIYPDEAMFTHRLNGTTAPKVSRTFVMKIHRRYRKNHH